MRVKKKVVKKLRTLSEWRKENPLKYRVQNFMGTLRKTGEAVPERLEILALTEASLGTRCPYCLTTLTVETVSLDHTVPKARVARKSEQNALSNLQCVCRECNQVKGEFTHNEFTRLLEVLDAEAPEALAIFRKRMKMATMVYGRRR